MRYVLAAVQESIEEAEDSGQRSDYSLEFDDAPDSPVLGPRGNQQDGESHAGSAEQQRQRRQAEEQEGARRSSGGLASCGVTAGDDSLYELYSPRRCGAPHHNS